MEEAHRALSLNLRPSPFGWSLVGEPGSGLAPCSKPYKAGRGRCALTFGRAMPGMLSSLEFIDWSQACVIRAVWKELGGVKGRTTADLRPGEP